MTSNIEKKGNCSQAHAVHTFTVDGRDFALDVNSGIFFEVDDLVRDVIELYTKCETPEEIADRLEERHDKRSVIQAIEEFEKLKDKDFLFANDKFSGYRADDNHIISSICMMISQDCNLRCAYCYAETGTFGRERQIMSEDVAKKSIDFLFRHCGNNSFLTVVFFVVNPC